MTYEQVLEAARQKLSPVCNVCPRCDGKVCRGRIPGPGGKGLGDAFVRNVEKLREISLNLDTIYENKGQDPSCTLLGHTFAAPVFAAPIGGIAAQYTAAISELDYDLALVQGCADAGLMAFTGDGVNDQLMKDALEAIGTRNGLGIPTIKPWNKEKVLEKLALCRAVGVPAVCMDIDAAGLPFLAAQGGDAGAKSVQALGEIIQAAGIPFLVKGVMTLAGARKALEAGAWGIVVSNHGGRVLDSTPATCQVLPAIRQEVGNRMTVLVDGGVRSGGDVFKMLALGADGVLIGRPYAVAAYGGGAQGVALYSRMIIDQLVDVMKMTGCATREDIGPDKITL